MHAPMDVERALQEPAERVGTALLALTESQWFDRKSSRVKARALADALVGFANADGGIVVVGLSEGRVEGTDSLGPARNDLMQAPLDFCIPPVRAASLLVPCVADDGRPDHLLAFEIRPSAGIVHANQKDEMYLRVGDENRRLTFAQRQELTFDRGPGSYEARPLTALDAVELDDVLLGEYVKAVGATDRTRLLQARSLLDKGMLNVAGCLLFASHPQTLLPEALVRVLRYQGSERGAGARQRLVADERFEGPIPRILQQAHMQIRSVQPARRALGREGRFERVALIPEDAWLEGLVNAVVHRSYSLAGDHIRVEVFDDRIEIASPGRFPGIVDLTDPMSAPRFARNPRIARVCADLYFGQELGEGIRRIYEEMRLAGLEDPVYTQTEASVRLVLSGEPMERQLDARLPPEVRAVTAALREAGRLSTGEVAELLNRSRPFALKVLRSLEAPGIVRRVGKSPKDPRAYWELAR